jgi:integrase
LKAIDALRRYLQARERHLAAHHPELWIGHRGPMKANGIYQVIKSRAEKANINGVFVHRFRHTWAHRWLVAGGAELDAMTIAGWTSARMLQRYGKSAAQERAQKAHKRIAPGDTI